MTPAERSLVFALCEKLYTVSQHLSFLAEKKRAEQSENSVPNCIDNVPTGCNTLTMRTIKVKRSGTRVKTFRLSPETLAQLDRLAKLFGLSNRTEVIRFLANRESGAAGKN